MGNAIEIVNEKDTSKYPECEKMAKVQPFSQKCGEFLEWLENEKKALLMQYSEGAKEFLFIRQSREVLLAEFFGIDLNKVEQERRAMLEGLRNGK